MRNVERWGRFPQHSYGSKRVIHRFPPPVSRRATACNRLVNGQPVPRQPPIAAFAPDRPPRSNGLGPDERYCVANDHEILHGVVGDPRATRQHTNPARL
jgi:hypothetical protein